MACFSLRSRNILLISPESWNHLYVSKHHYAIELAKNNLVYFLNPPAESFNLSETEYPNLKVINYAPFFPGLRFLPTWLQRYLMKRKFMMLQQSVGVQFDCIWSFDNSVFYDFSFLPIDILKISHIVDYSQNFQFEKAASTATVCFGVSQNIVDRLKKNNPNSFLIPHGVSLTRKETKKVDLPGNNLIKAMYAGNLDSKYIDTALFFELIRSNPTVDFIILGSGGNDWPRLRNTYYLGKVDHLELCRYFEQADVLLLIYDTKRFDEQLTNSHKILEYLSSGKVIISKIIRDYIDTIGLLEMAKDKDEFIGIFKTVISDLPSYNLKEKMDIRRSYALRNTYEKRIIQIESILRGLKE